MNRYIDADKLVEYEEHAWDWDTVNGIETAIALRQVISDIRHEPTADVVEVVRCCDAEKGDCMFNHWHETPHGKKYHICNLTQSAFSEHDDFYCAYGERREDDKG